MAPKIAYTPIFLLTFAAEWKTLFLNQFMQFYNGEAFTVTIITYPELLQDLSFLLSVLKLMVITLIR